MTSDPNCSPSQVGARDPRVHNYGRWAPGSQLRGVLGSKTPDRALSSFHSHVSVNVSRTSVPPRTPTRPLPFARTGGLVQVRSRNKQAPWPSGPHLRTEHCGMPDAVLSGREQGRRCPESSRQQTQAGRRAAGAWDGQLSQGAGVHPGWCPRCPLLGGRPSDPLHGEGPQAPGCFWIPSILSLPLERV